MASASVNRPGRPARRRVLTGRLRSWLQPQVSSGAREQRDQAVLLLAVALVVAPHFEHLRTWSFVALASAWAWRAWLTQTLKPAPDRFVMFVLLALGTGGVWWEYGTLIGRDAGVNFLLVLIGLKVLEMRAHRDIMVIVFLSLFVLLTQFLYDQTLMSAATMVLSVGMLFFVLLSVHLREGDISFVGKLRYLGRVFLLALPLTLTLFFLFPRISTPIWHSGSDDIRSGTGLSDSMSPGGIRELLRNDNIALRAKFEHRVPQQRELYWRGPVFGLFDGRTWIAFAPPEAAPAGSLPLHTMASTEVDYTVTLEATRRRELIALEAATEIDGVPTASSRITSNLELIAASPVTQRRNYHARSFTSFSLGPLQFDDSLAPWLQLPEQYNPRTLRWASELRTQIEAQARADQAHGSTAMPIDRQLVDAVLLHFRRDPFRYSLTTPVLGRNTVDEFLFETRVGYCEHYASAFVVLMRAMGIPARVVTGYQGGEINPIDGYLIVRQSDAHAWSEVWLEGRGWQRVDPTAAVAPERVEHSTRERRAEGFDGSMEGWSWLTALRANREALENAWNQWVLTYSAERQRALLAHLGLTPKIENIAILAIVVFSGLLVLLAIVSLRRRAKREPLSELVFQLRGKLARAGIAVPATMGLQEMEEYLEARLEPSCLPEIRRLLADIGAARYARPKPGARPAQVRAMRRALSRWTPVVRTLISPAA